MSSPKRLARSAGVLYLLVGIFGGFAVIPCAVAEISMVVYLLVVGVKTVKPDKQNLAAT